ETAHRGSLRCDRPFAAWSSEPRNPQTQMTQTREELGHGATSNPKFSLEVAERGQLNDSASRIALRDKDLRPSAQSGEKSYRHIQQSAETDPKGVTVALESPRGEGRAGKGRFVPRRALRC